MVIQGFYFNALGINGDKHEKEIKKGKRARNSRDFSGISQRTVCTKTKPKQSLLGWKSRTEQQ